MTYEITNTVSGHSLGCYDAASTRGALDLMARCAGYSDYRALQAEVPAEEGEIVVTPISDRSAQQWAPIMDARNNPHDYIVVDDGPDLTLYTRTMLAGVTRDTLRAMSDYSEWCSGTPCESTTGTWGGIRGMLRALVDDYGVEQWWIAGEDR